MMEVVIQMIPMNLKLVGTDLDLPLLLGMEVQVGDLKHWSGQKSKQVEKDKGSTSYTIFPFYVLASITIRILLLSHALGFSWSTNSLSGIK